MKLSERIHRLRSSDNRDTAAGGVEATAAAEASLRRAVDAVMAVFPGSRAVDAQAPPPAVAPQPCPHVTDPLFVDWHAHHPELVCARCWFEAQDGLADPSRGLSAAESTPARIRSPPQLELPGIGAASNAMPRTQQTPTRRDRQSRGRARASTTE